MKRSDVERKMQEEIVKQVSIEHRIEGILKLYDACLISADQPGYDRHREDLHTLLDMKLDSKASVAILARQMIFLKD